MSKLEKRLEEIEQTRELFHLKGGLPRLLSALRKSIEQRNGIYETLNYALERVGVGTDTIKQFATMAIADVELLAILEGEGK